MEPVIVQSPIDLPPMLRFAAIAFLLLFLPSLTRRLRIPACVGFIVAGILVGPHGLGIVPRNAEVASFFAELGKLLLMFFIGLEIDVEQFIKSRRRSLVFGLTTFALPMMAGMAVGLAFGYPILSAVLIGSLLASHTLIAYPLVKAHGEIARPSVTVTVGATILTDILSLLVLAVCVTTHKTGFDALGFLLQLVETAAFIAVVLIGFGWGGRWLYDRYGRTDDACFALLLLIVSSAAVLAEAINLEGILGAFVAGLAVNTAVRASPGKEKLEFLGNALFIPAFFIATGFLIDLSVFLRTVWLNAPIVAAVVLGLIAAKWLAAQIVGWAFGFGAADRGLMGSLTLPQVAATLAVALVGYQALNATGQRLIDDSMLNTVLVLVIVTSVLGPVLTEYFLKSLAPAPRAEPPAIVPTLKEAS